MFAASVLSLAACAAAAPPPAGGAWEHVGKYMAPGLRLPPASAASAVRCVYYI